MELFVLLGLRASFTVYKSYFVGMLVQLQFITHSNQHRCVQRI